MTKINYNVNNRKLAALFVAADCCLLSFGSATLRNPLMYQKYLVNYQGIHPENKTALTDKFDRALDAAVGIPVSEWGNLQARIHILQEKVLVDAGIFRVEITYEGRSYRIRYTEPSQIGACA